MLCCRFFERSEPQNCGFPEMRSNAAAKRGSNQVPDRRRTSCRAASMPLVVWKTSATCASNAMRERIGMASPPMRGQSAAVPMLVEALDALRHGFRDPHLARDIGTALAASLDQLHAGLAAVLERAAERAKPLVQRRLQAGMAEDEAQRLRHAVAVDVLVVAFELEIVGQIELADARGVAAATKVLEEQSVV